MIVSDYGSTVISLAGKSVCVSGIATFIAQVTDAPIAGQLGTMGCFVAAILWLVKALSDSRQREADKEVQFQARLDAKDKQIEAKGEQVISMTVEVTKIMVLAIEAVKEGRASDMHVTELVTGLREEILRAERRPYESQPK